MCMYPYITYTCTCIKMKTRMIITMTNALAKGRFLKYNIYIQFIFPLTIALDIYDVQSLPTHGA